MLYFIEKNVKIWYSIIGIKYMNRKCKKIYLKYGGDINEVRRI